MVFLEFSGEQMQDVFEAFVRNFLSRELSSYRVGSENLRWQGTFGEEQAMSYLPTMTTDVSCVSDDRKLVIEVKYYQETFARRRRGSGKPIRSLHLYQLFAYLQNLSHRDGREIEGLLLYPKTDKEITLEYELFDHKIRVTTIDLMQSPREIGERLLALALQTVAAPTGHAS